MSRPMLFRALLLALITALVVLPAAALAAKPDVFHEHFSFTEEDVDVCGVTVDIAGEGVFTVKDFFDEEGNFVRSLFTNSAKVTYTAANGKSVVVQQSGQQTETFVAIDEVAGTITTFVTFKGIPEKIKTVRGPVLLRDVGLATFLVIRDLETGDVISMEPTIVKGPHPELESDFTLFCEVFTEALA